MEDKFTHVDFWLAIGAAAPVILLSNAVVMTQMLRSRVGVSMVVGYASSGLASVLCSIATANALISLAHRQDSGVWKSGGALVFVTVALPLTVLAAICAGFAAEDERKV